MQPGQVGCGNIPEVLVKLYVGRNKIEIPPCEWGWLKADAHVATTGKILLFNPYQANYKAFKVQYPPLNIPPPTNIKSYNKNLDELMCVLQPQVPLGSYRRRSPHLEMAHSSLAQL